MNAEQLKEFNQTKEDAKTLQVEYKRLGAIRPITEEINEQIRIVAGQFSRKIEHMTKLDNINRILGGYNIGDWNE